MQAAPAPAAASDFFLHKRCALLNLKQSVLLQQQEKSPLMQRELVKGLLDPACYDHPVGQVELIETHISWVFLAGDFAYKLKKALDLGFLDFSTLARRKFFCAEELRLNRRFAADLYLEVITVGGDPANPRLRGEPVLDYLVKMKRFDQRQQLDRMLADGLLNASQLQSFAEKIAAVHRTAEVAAATDPQATVAAVIGPALENFAQLQTVPAARQLAGQIDRIEAWTRQTGAQLQSRFVARRAAGYVRECHGDLHLRNMAWLHGEPILFDCIEFSEELRWIDTISDIAFLVMDLDDRHEEELGWRFFDSYLQNSGDFGGLSLLRYYLVYRAMVRAKVSGLQLAQATTLAEEQGEGLARFASYVDLAETYIASPRPELILTHGLSGSGKTFFVNQLAPKIKAVVLHSDVERKRLRWLESAAANSSPPGGGRYTPAARQQVYQHLHRLAGEILTAGFKVIVDATFLQRADRQLLLDLAVTCRVPVRILDFTVPVALLRERLRARAAVPGELSEADEAVLEFQLAHAEPLSAAEEELAIKVAAGTGVDAVAEALLK